MSVSDVFDIFGFNKKPPTDWKKYYIKKPTVCYMVPIYSDEDDERLPRPKIELQHDKFTNIAKDGTIICGDMDVSYTHVTAVADAEQYVVIFMYVGTTGAWFNDRAMNRAVRYTLTHGDKIYLQKSKFWYQIAFDPVPIAAKHEQLDDSNSFKANQPIKSPIKYDPKPVPLNRRTKANNNR